MKKTWSMLLCALLLAIMPAAMAQTQLEGKVQAGRVLSITAPYSGTVGDFAAQAGDQVTAGEMLFPLGTTKVYAETDGVISGLFALPGDSAQAAAAKYGALCYLEPQVQFEAACTSMGADTDVEDKIVHPGETVYLKSTQNSERDGKGRVTSVTAQGYTVEILDMGKMRIGENVKIYRDSDHDADSCIGSGRTAWIAPQAVTGEGYVLSCYVAEGQVVARGDLLFEMAPEALEGMRGGESAALMPQDGVLLAVYAKSGARAAQHEVLATYCPEGEYEVVCPADEMDLAGVKVGARVRVVLDAFEEAPVDGEVTGIALAADEAGAFNVTVKLLDTQNVRIGMTATVEL